MKLSLLGMAAFSMIVGSATLSSADTRGYDPLALDHFAGANLAMVTSKAFLDPKQPGNDKLAFAGSDLRYDADGYLIGPDGKRAKKQMRIRWQVGVFR